MTTDLPSIACGEIRQEYYILFEKIICKRKKAQNIGNLPFCSCFSLALCKWNPRQSWIQDSTPWILDSSYWIPDLFQWILDSGFQLLVGFPDSYSCIPDLKAQDSGFHKPKFPGFPHSGRFFYIFLFKVSQVRIQVVTPLSRSPRLRSCDQQRGCLFRWKRVTTALGPRLATPMLQSWTKLLRKLYTWGTFF